MTRKPILNLSTSESSRDLSEVNWTSLRVAVERLSALASDSLVLSIKEIANGLSQLEKDPHVQLTLSDRVQSIMERYGIDYEHLSNRVAIYRLTDALIQDREYLPMLKAYAGRQISNKNLHPPPKGVTDERIREVIADSRFPTREKQAEHLGFKDVRSLQKRLKSLQ